MFNFFDADKSPRDRIDEECNESRSQNPINVPADRAV